MLRPLLTGPTSSSSLPSFPNVRNHCSGYDIIRGNPFSNLNDPGWQSPIIRQTYTQNNTWDNAYAIPDWLQVRTEDACSYMGTSSVMTSASEYQVCQPMPAAGIAL